ncbi:MAG: hypothetical protein QOG54_931 [Actinomycetota bacterium]|nr:hypothetical protein [Actinomycetota bacterium]
MADVKTIRNEQDTIVQEILIEASPETVFPYFTDPERMIQWKGIEADLEARPGGKYRVSMNGRDVVLGEYILIEPFTRIVFTWGWEGPENPVRPGSTTVEIELEPRGDSTMVRLTHSGLAEPARQPHAEGWIHFLPRLATRAAGGDPGPDPYAVPPK